MGFTNELFIYIFFPIFIILYGMIAKWLPACKKIVLLLFDLIFLIFGGISGLLLIVIFSIYTYIASCILKKYHYKYLLLLFVIIMLIPLLRVKYTTFIFANINAWFNTDYEAAKIAMPLGISFFTFMSISALSDSYLGKIKITFIDTLSYLAFFPIVVSGPVARYTSIQEGLNKKEYSFSELDYGISRFIMGLTKKILLANKIAIVADYFFNIVESGQSASMAGLWIGAICYSLQLYLDFSGYSDMAIGVAHMIGVHLDENFNYPYAANSMQDFWRRWHISLSRWFRDYIYIPFGGNRVSKSRHIFNMLVVWLCTGIWHGANWTFIIWGLGNFIFLIAEKYLPKLPSLISRIYTLLIVNFLWVIFKSSSIEVAIKYIQGMFTSKEAIETATTSSLPLVFICILMSFPLYQLVKKYEDQYWFILIKDIVLLVLLMVCVNAIRSSTYSPFIYGNF